MFTVNQTFSGNTPRTYDIGERDAYAIAKQVLKELREETVQHPQAMSHLREVYVDFYADFIEDVVMTASCVVNARLDNEEDQLCK